MHSWMDKTVGVVATLAFVMTSTQSLPAQQTNPSQSSQQDAFVYKANAELVLTNVVVRDSKTGELVRGLKQSDFTIFENGKQQQIATFDFQSVEMAMPLNEATVSGLAAGANGIGSKTAMVARPEDLRCSLRISTAALQPRATF